MQLTAACFSQRKQKVLREENYFCFFTLIYDTLNHNRVSHTYYLNQVSIYNNQKI